MTDLTKIDDEGLLAEYVATGDGAALGELYLRYMPLVYGLSLKYLGSAADAEDAAMEIFEELVVKVREHRVRNFRTWLWSVARNHCLMRLRREKRNVRVDFDDRVVESAAFLHLLGGASRTGDYGGAPDSNEEKLTALPQCMERLPERQREAITLFFVEHKSYADIADETLGQVKSVKSNIQNGKRNLRLCLEKKGVKL